MSLVILESILSDESLPSCPGSGGMRGRGISPPEVQRRFTTTSQPKVGSRERYLTWTGILLVTVLALMTADSVTAAQLCGHLGVKNKFKKLHGGIIPKVAHCRFSYSQWMCIDGEKISYITKPVIRQHCNSTAYGKGWREVGVDRTSYDVRYLNFPKRHRGYKVQATALFSESGCKVTATVKVGKGPAEFAVSRDFDTCQARQELPLRVSIYANEQGRIRMTHPGYGLEKDGVGGFLVKEVRASGGPAREPDPWCGDGVVNVDGEQCDSSNDECDANEYCNSACRCATVAPFSDGTWIRTPNGNVYRSVGNSPVWMSTCEKSGYYPGCPADFWKSPQEFVDAVLAVYPIPVDGALIRRPDGAVFQMRSGRAEYVRSCADVGSCNGLVDLDRAAVDRLGGRAPGDNSLGHGLGVGAHLPPGEYLDSPDGMLKLVHQTDGNVVLYRDGAALWSSGTHGQATATLVMQTDGNLVLYAPSGAAVWNTGTHGHPGATLTLQSDCNVVVYDPGGQALWNAGTWRACGTCWIECCRPHGHFVTLNGTSRPMCGGVSACTGPWGGVRNRLFLPNYIPGPAEWLFHNPNC